MDGPLIAPNRRLLNVAVDGDVVLDGDGDVLLDGDSDVVLDGDVVPHSNSDVVLDGDMVLHGDGDVVLDGDAVTDIAGLIDANANPRKPPTPTAKPPPESASQPPGDPPNQQHKRCAHTPAR